MKCQLKKIIQPREGGREAGREKGKKSGKERARVGEKK